MQSKWTDGEVMPQQLVDVLENSLDEAESDSDSVELDGRETVEGMSTDSDSDSDDDSD